MRWRPVIIVALLTLGLVAMLAYGFGRDPHAVPSVLESRPAPEFTAVTMDGKRLSLAELRGKPVVLNFWSTWCIPCLSEHELLQNAARAYDGDVYFFGVVYQDEIENVRRQLASHGSTYPHLVDPDTRIAIDYGVAGVPETFFIDRNGVLRRKVVGPVTPDVVQDTLQALLSEKGSG